MNLPNAITLVRLLLIPVFVFSFYYYGQSKYYIPLLILLIAGITDFLDGFIARRFNLVTKWGKILDPLVDKLLQISVLFVLTSAKLIPLWIIIVVFLKEFLMIIGSGVLYKKKIVVQASWYGKVTTILFYIAIIIVITIGGRIGTFSVAAVAIFSVYAAVMYALKYFTGASEVSSFTLQK